MAFLTSRPDRLQQNLRFAPAVAGDEFAYSALYQALASYNTAVYRLTPTSLAYQNDVPKSISRLAAFK